MLLSTEVADDADIKRNFNHIAYRNKSGLTFAPPKHPRYVSTTI